MGLSRLRQLAALFWNVARNLGKHFAVWTEPGAGPRNAECWKAPPGHSWARSRNKLSLQVLRKRPQSH